MLIKAVRTLSNEEAEHMLAEIIARYLAGEDEIVALSEYEWGDMLMGRDGVKEHPGNAWYDIGASLYDALVPEVETN